MAKPIPAPAKSRSAPTARCRCTAIRCWAKAARSCCRSITAVEVGTDGTISVLTEGAKQMQVVDKLRLVNATGAELTKNEAGLIVSRDGGNLPTDPNVKVRPRALEGSNVSAVEEMVATMSLNRSFEVQMQPVQGQRQR